MTGTDTYSGEDLLTTGEAAEVAHVSISTLFRAEKAGKITPLRTPGGHRRYRRSEVETLLGPAPVTDARNDRASA